MEKRDDYRKKLMIAGAAVLLIFISVGLVLFFGEKNQNPNEKSVKTEKGKDSADNNRVLLEYGAERFDGRTYAAFFDLTGDGLDELIVFDDEEYAHPDVESILRTACIYSRIDADEIIEIDRLEIGSSDAFYLCKEEGKYFLYWEDATGLRAPGKASFCQIRYDGEGKKQITELASFQTEDEVQERGGETFEKAAIYKEEVMSYIKKCEGNLYVGFTTGDELSEEELPPFACTTLQEICEEYAIETMEKEGSGSMAYEEEEPKEGVQEIAALGLYETYTEINARVGDGCIYYMVEDDYYDKMRIQRYNTATHQNTKLYGTSGYPTIGYACSYKGKEYGVGENMIYRVVGDGSFEPLLNEEVLPSFCIMENKLYYLSNMLSEDYVLYAYDLLSGNRESVCNVEKVKDRPPRILGVTSSFILIRMNEKVYVIGKSGGYTGKSFETTKVKLSWSESDCVYVNENGGIYKLNLASDERTDIMTSEDWIGIFGDNKIEAFDFLGNELYVIHNNVLYKVDVANKSVQEILGSANDIIADKDYLLIEGKSKADKYYMQYGIPLYYYKAEEGVVMVE